MTRTEAIHYLTTVVEPDTILYFQRLYHYAHRLNQWYRVTIHPATPVDITLPCIYAVPHMTAHSKIQGTPLLHIYAHSVNGSSARRLAYHLSKCLFPTAHRQGHVFMVQLLNPICITVSPSRH